MSIPLYTLLAVLLTIGFGWWQRWLKPSPTARQHPPKRMRTFRVRGVPREWDRRLLESLLAEQDDSAGATVRSLANEIHGRSQTATVCFRNVPPQLLEAEGQGRSWEIPLPTPSDQSAEPQTLRLDDGFLGVTTLFTPSPQNHKVDIITIPGLGGHAFGSFKERHGEHMWLRDALPGHITGEGVEEPIARVMLYGYSSGLLQHDNFQTLEDLATSFRESLRGLVVQGTHRPIIFIAHSLGGLVVRETLISLSQSKLEEDQTLLRAVYGVAFFGVPHAGMDISSLIPMVGDGRNRFLLESIGRFSSQVLDTQHREFTKALGGEGESEIVCFYETRESPTAEKDINGEWKMTGPPAVLVTKPSATHCRPWENGPAHICAIDRAHSEMVKFGSEDHEYEKVLARLELLVRRAIAAPRRPLQPKLSKQAEDCLKSLDFPRMEHRALDIDIALQGTCQWLLQHKKYTAWSACDRGLLWIKGKPGAGKSTLLRYALEHHGAGANALVLSFFFHGRGDELQRTPLGLFRSLLHQILRQAPDALQDLIDTFETKSNHGRKLGENWHWHEAELRTFLKLSLPRILKTRPVWLFVDALEECGKDNAVRLVENLKALLKSLPSHSIGLWPFRVCFSSILSLGEYGFEICADEENRMDIATFEDTQLADVRARLPAIPDLITKRASGVFMWDGLVVELVVDLDRCGCGPNKIEAEVSSTPSKLEKLYQEITRSMTPASLKLIQWLCFAKQPLTLDDLRWAIVADVDCPHKSLKACESDNDYVPDHDWMKRQVETLCRGLVEVTSSQVVQLIHQSVKDFFVNKGFDGSLTPTKSARRALVRLSKL